MSKQDDDLDGAIRKVEKTINEIDPAGAPKRQEAERVRDAEWRNKMGLLPTHIPTPISEEELAAEDEQVARVRKEAIANSQSYDKQPGESDDDYRHRVERLNRREVERSMTGAERMQRDAILAQMAQDDFLRANPYPRGEIAKIEGNSYTLTMQPHPNLPKTLLMPGNQMVVRQIMQAYMEDNEPRLRPVTPVVGAKGMLRSTVSGLTVFWFLVLDAAA